MSTCNACGSLLRDEDLETEQDSLCPWRCANCGEVSWFHFTPALPRDPYFAAPVRVVVHWAADVPTPRELFGLRKMVGVFRNLGVLQVKEAVCGKDGWVLGVFPRGLALTDLSESAKQNGLSLELVEIEDEAT